MESTKKYVKIPAGRKSIRLSSKLEEAVIETVHAKVDADVLNDKTAKDSTKSNNTILIGDDTDLLVLLCSHATDIPYTPYLDQSLNHLLDLAEMKKGLGEEMCSNILFLHVFLGCDTWQRRPTENIQEEQGI